MKHLVIAASLALAGLTNPALAGMNSFERAFTGICLASLPDLRAAPDMFRAEGWKGGAAAAAGKFEFFKDGTSVLLSTADAGARAGCTVQDDEPARIQALWLMELWLDKHHEGRWKQVDSNYGPVWQLRLAEGSVVFVLADDPGGEGGATVTFEVRP